MKSLLESLNINFPMEEDNTTSSIEPYNTPKAFKNKSSDEEYDERIEELYKRLFEVSYKDFKGDSDSTEKQKINRHIQEINKRLREVEQMLTHATKLKLESGATQTVFWKDTLEKFQKIDQRLGRLSNKIREINT